MTKKSPARQDRDRAKRSQVLGLGALPPHARKQIRKEAADAGVSEAQFIEAQRKAMFTQPDAVQSLQKRMEEEARRQGLSPAAMQARMHWAMEERGKPYIYTAQEEADFAAIRANPPEELLPNERRHLLMDMNLAGPDFTELFQTVANANMNEPIQRQGVMEACDHVGVPKLRMNIDLMQKQTLDQVKPAVRWETFA